MSDYIIGGRREDVERIAKQDNPPKDLSKLSEKDYVKEIRISSLFPPNRPNLVTADKEDSVAVVFKSLIDHKILSVPVIDSNKNVCLGLVDILDMVCYVVEVASEADLRSFTQLLETSEKLHHMKCGNIAGSSGRNPYYPVEENASLLVAMDLMIKNKIHRIPVIDSTGSIITIITQSHVVALISKHMYRFSIGSNTVEELKLGLKEVLTISENERAIEAFKLIYSKKVSGVGVVDSEGTLIGNISGSDLKNIGSSGLMISRLFLPIDQYLKLTSISDQIKAHSVTTTARFDEVIRKLVDTSSHRIFVVNQQGKPIGVISLVDVLEVFLANLKS